MKKNVFLGLAITMLLAFQTTVNASTRESNSYEISSGVELSGYIKSAPIGSELNFKVNEDITIADEVKIPENVKLHIDMNGHALYTKGLNSYRVSSGNEIIFENEKMVATGEKNDIKVPDPKGKDHPLVSGKYNAYYGLFRVNPGTLAVIPKITFKNVTQDLGSIKNWGGGSGQPFYNYGVQVEFSGDNYFNYPGTGQEFMEGAGIKVLDGKTEIKGSNKNGYSFVQQTWGGKLGETPTGIDVAKDATLYIDYATSGAVNGVWALAGGGGAKASEFHIKNEGILRWANIGSKSKHFFSTHKLDIPFIYDFAPDSKTEISVGGMFNYGLTSKTVTTKVGENATFVYSNNEDEFAFLGDPKYGDKIEINSANEVRFSTQKKFRRIRPESILGKDETIMPISLNGHAYDMLGYNARGSLVIDPFEKSGGFGINGTFHPSLGDMGKLTGINVPGTRTEILGYRTVAQLQFIKHIEK